jgi:hypothetical protein
MAKWTGYRAEDLKEAVEDLKQFLLEVNPKFLKTLEYKFKKNEYLGVAFKKFEF